MIKIPKKEFFQERLSLILSRLNRNRESVLKGKDPEALHDFRVTLRRLRTWLRMLQSCYPHRVLNPVLSGLHRITSDTNHLRDQEVFRARLKSLSPLSNPSVEFGKWLQAEEDLRREEEQKIREILASEDFSQWFSRLSKKLVLGAQARPIALQAAEAFQVEQRKLRKGLQKTRSPRTRPALLHQLRVQAKRVRYCLEEFTFLLPGRARIMAAKCKKIQDALGEWRDLERARDLLKRAGNGHFPETRSWLGELNRQRAAEWKKARKAIHSLQEALS